MPATANLPPGERLPTPCPTGPRPPRPPTPAPTGQATGQALPCLPPAAPPPAPCRGGGGRLPPQGRPQGRPCPACPLPPLPLPPAEGEGDACPLPCPLPHRGSACLPCPAPTGQALPRGRPCHRAGPQGEGEFGPQGRRWGTYGDPLVFVATSEKRGSTCSFSSFAAFAGSLVNL